MAVTGSPPDYYSARLAQGGRPSLSCALSNRAMKPRFILTGLIAATLVVLPQIGWAASFALSSNSTLHEPSLGLKRAMFKAG